MPDTRTGSSEICVTIETLVDRNATVARVEFDDYLITGSSKRDKGDSYDPFLGEQFAIARALINLGQTMEQDANKIVRKRCP
jgi:hypothetical protein